MDLDLSQLGDYVANEIKKIRDSAEKACKQSLEQAIDAADEEAIPIEMETIKDIFRDSIERFYDSYSPKYYSRNRSLFDIAELERINGGFRANLDSSAVTPFRDGGDGVYELVFKKGWHGGAMGKADIRKYAPSSMSWRTPYGYYTYWGDKATRADISPWEDFAKKAREYWEDASDYQEILDKKIEEYLSKAGLGRG